MLQVSRVVLQYVDLSRSSRGSRSPLAAQRPTRYATELVTSSVETFELFAELSIALAGFTGVAAAFGGRDREFSRIDRGRLDAVFLYS